MLDAQVIDRLEDAEALAEDWDALAQGCALPLCAPGWMLAWWRHVAPRSGLLRIIAVRDDSQLVGLAPWFIGGTEGRRDLRFLGAQLSDRVDVLCRDGREREVADVFGGVLRELQPAPDLIAFEAVPASSEWTRRLSSGRSALRMSRYRNSAYPAPSVRLPPGAPGEWLAGRSSNFRSQMRRLRRKLESSGGAVRQIRDEAEVPRAIEALLALHESRWEGRGVSGLAAPGVAELLQDAAASLGPERLRLFVAEIDGEPVSVQLFLAAGGEVKYWNGGWAEEHAALKPSMLTILAAIEDGIARGERRLDLGVGTHAYKLRFADSEDTLTWGGLIVRNRRYAQTRAELLPRVLRYRAKTLLAAMPSSLRERLEPALRRGGDE
jgi:CelD/BcsL family acetyltransferase involved in cellulose biosynthesis